MNLWLPILAVLITIGLVYFALYKILNFLYHRHFEWFVASLIFLSPFGFVMLQARNLLQLMWILLLTPFYGIFLLLLFSTWTLQFYCLAFATLLISWFLIRQRKTLGEVKGNPAFEAFLVQHLRGRFNFAEFGENRIGGMVRKVGVAAHRLSKFWSLGLSVLLLFVLASTLVSSAAPTNPTYAQAQQFVASDKTNSHQYVEGSYTCVNFATDFRNTALKAGYLCGYAFVYFPDSQNHVLDCFNTTDRGIVFVEPQWDRFVSITVGEPYESGNRTLSVENSTVLWYYVDFQNSPQMP